MALTKITQGVIKSNENYNTHNINSTGIITATELDVNGNADISGNLNVGGVLTYDDVTNIDSVGVITARSEIHTTGDVGIGTNNPQRRLDIFEDDATDTVVQIRSGTGNREKARITKVNRTTGNGDLQIQSSSGGNGHSIVFLTDSSGEERMHIGDDGGVGIGTNNPATNFKLDVNGDLSLGELGGSDNTYIDQKQNGNLEIINSGRTASTGGVRINRHNNISGDTTYFRDFEVYDGKDNLLLLADGSSGRIGIGTNDPNTELDVAGAISLRNGSELNGFRTNSDGRLEFFRNGSSNNQVTLVIDDANGNVGIGSTIPTQALDVDGRITKTEYEPGEIIERICSVCDGSTHVVKSGSYTITNVTAAQSGSTSDAVCSGSQISYKCPAGAKRIHYEYWFKWEAAERSGISHFFIEVDDDDVVPSRRTFANNFSRYSTTYYHHGEGWYCMNWVFECDASSTDTSEGQYDSWASSEQTKVIRTKFREYNSSYEMILHSNYYWDGAGVTSGVNHHPIKPMLIITTTA